MIHISSDINECSTSVSVTSSKVELEESSGNYESTNTRTMLSATSTIPNDDESEVCDFNAQCSNTVGSYVCKCDEGYVGDGFNCVLSPPITKAVFTNEGN